MLFLQRGKHPDAEQDLTESIRLSVRNTSAYINRALARYHQNNLSVVMADYDVALDIHKENLIGHYNRGSLWCASGR